MGRWRRLFGTLALGGTIGLRVWILRVCLAGLEDDVVDLAAIVKGVVVVAGASEAPESLSLAVIVEWWWNNSVVDSKMHGKEKISPLATKNTPVRLRSTLHFLLFKLHHRTTKTISPD